MLKRLKLKNFRNFDKSEFFFGDKDNAIVGENWKWKTNILEAIALLNLNQISKIDFDNLIKTDESIFYIEVETELWDKISLSYDKKTKRKKYIFNSKPTTRKKISSIIWKAVFFSPIVMNIMYLSPNLRRHFLDEILNSAFEDYKKITSEYKKILSSRNKVLKNIRENKSDKSEIKFWDKKFAIKSSQIYNYRFWIINFLKENTKDFTKYFENKISNCEFIYKTKIIPNKTLEKPISWILTPSQQQGEQKKERLEDIQKQILDYLLKNIDRDIILWITNIWPHTDDFDILVDNVSLVEFASRWEVKSVIIWLKILEIKFIEKFLNKKPILLIDDLLSELDNKHKNILIENIKWYQTFITSIRNDYKESTNIINL